MTGYQPEHTTSSQVPPAGHEPLQVSTGALVIFIIVFTVALVAVLAVVAGQYAVLSAKYENRGPQPSPLAAGRYTLAVMNVMRWAAGAFIVVLGSTVAMLIYRGRRQASQTRQAAEPIVS